MSVMKVQDVTLMVLKKKLIKNTEIFYFGYIIWLVLVVLTVRQEQAISWCHVCILPSNLFEFGIFDKIYTLNIQCGKPSIASVPISNWYLQSTNIIKDIRSLVNSCYNSKA